MSSENAWWMICVDRGDNRELKVTEGTDVNKICIRIGQLVLSLGIEKIIVYKNYEEYRRYELKPCEIEEDNDE